MDIIDQLNIMYYYFEVEASGSENLEDRRIDHVIVGIYSCVKLKN